MDIKGLKKTLARLGIAGLLTGAVLTVDGCCHRCKAFGGVSAEGGLSRCCGEFVWQGEISRGGAGGAVAAETALS